MSKISVTGSKSRCQQGEPQGAGGPSFCWLWDSSAGGRVTPVSAPRWHGPRICRHCVGTLSLPFFIRTLTVHHLGSSPHLKIFNLFPPAKSFLAIQGHIRRSQELGTLVAITQPSVGPLGRVVRLWGKL